MARATYQCTALMGTNKKGALKADADGYYPVILGALDYYNSAGAFYALEPAKKLFEESSSLMRRVNNGTLRGEYGHPRFEPGMNKRDFLMRVLDVKEQCVSHHIKEVTLDYDSVKDKNGKAVVTIMGRIKPAGPYGDKLAASLENPSENVCFSIRSLTDDLIDPNGRHVKNLQQIVTWDYVNEPGIAVANKWEIPTLEDFDSVRFTKEQLILAKNLSASIGNGMESDRTRMLQEAMRAFGWNEGGVLVPKTAARPASARC